MEGIILSSWDHIMGPQIEKLWYAIDSGSSKLVEVPCDILRDFNMTKYLKNAADSTAENPLPDLQAYSIMCGQLLLGEVDSCKPCDEWASRFYLSESKILITVVFHLNSWECSAFDSKNDKDMCLCFGTIFERHALKFALDNQQVIDLHLRKAIDIMQNSKIPYDLVMKEITAIVENIVSFLESLKAFNLHSIQPPEKPSFQEFIQSDLMSKAILSHLQTSGCSVVIGASDFLINQVIYVLSLFSTPKESCCSVIAPHVTSSSYIRGIYIQGAIKTMDVDCKYLSEKASKESFSLTIVDIDLCKVWQSITIKDLDIFRNILSPVMETGQIVPQLLKDLAFIQKNEGDSKLFVENFYEYLMVEATSLIKAIEPFRNSQSTITEKEVMAMFARHDIVDLKILFGCAEKLKPGFRNIIV